LLALRTEAQPAIIESLFVLYITVNCGQQGILQPAIPARDWLVYTYFEGLSSSAKNIEVVVSMGQANLDTVEVRSSSLLVPTIFSIGIERIPKIL